MTDTRPPAPERGAEAAPGVGAVHGRGIVEDVGAPLWICHDATSLTADHALALGQERIARVLVEEGDTVEWKPGIEWRHASRMKPGNTVDTPIPSGRMSSRRACASSTVGHRRSLGQTWWKGTLKPE